jgi:hypothetical protein
VAKPRDESVTNSNNSQATCRMEDRNVMAACGPCTQGKVTRAHAVQEQVRGQV